MTSSEIVQASKKNETSKNKHEQLRKEGQEGTETQPFHFSIYWGQPGISLWRNIKLQEHGLLTGITHLILNCQPVFQWTNRTALMTFTVVQDALTESSLQIPNSVSNKGLIIKLLTTFSMAGIPSWGTVCLSMCVCTISSNRVINSAVLQSTSDTLT